MSKQETIYYLETEDGDLMRVPESRLRQFQNLNTKKTKRKKSIKASLKNFVSKKK